jgi:hypothetical protein
MRDEYLISANLYNMLLAAIGGSDAKDTLHGVQLHQSYIQLQQLKPVGLEEDKA